MRGKIRQALIELVGRKDATVFQDPGIFSGALEQIAGEPSEEIAALTTALDEKIPWELRKPIEKTSLETVFQGLVDQLQEKGQIPSDLAHWAVETWGIALGVKIPKGPPAAAVRTEEPKPGELGIVFQMDEQGVIKVASTWARSTEKTSPQELVTIVKRTEPPAVRMTNQPVPSKSSEPVQTGSIPKTAVSAKSPGPEPRAKTIDQDAVQKEVADLYQRGCDLMKGKPNAQKLYEAAKFFLSASEKGHAPSQYLLGKMFFEGQGLLQNYQKSVKWLEMAANQGHADAQFFLGYIYQTGVGMPMNFREAAKWFQMAVDQGHAEAQRHLNQLPIS